MDHWLFSRLLLPDFQWLSTRVQTAFLGVLKKKWVVNGGNSEKEPLKYQNTWNQLESQWKKMWMSRKTKKHQAKFSYVGILKEAIHLWYCSMFQVQFPSVRTKSNTQSISLCSGHTKDPGGQVFLDLDGMWSRSQQTSSLWSSMGRLAPTAGVPVTAVMTMTYHSASWSPSGQLDWRRESQCKYALQNKQNNNWYE